ncbi:transmembrane protein 160-like [Physella acuta]|uniref:transmembrane protein 160-like n=1 Tax=Physella acuta TaxID=109671 RepID=UPI0027DC8751|nr:transmembrane protein 160-like [Physella acuta]XP_059176904.1 transmembrane protein 160-like [Physella acuta]XP_059176905.1 transmembrane protein 160-like [Physella acuta]
MTHLVLKLASCFKVRPNYLLFLKTIKLSPCVSSFGTSSQVVMEKRNFLGLNVNIHDTLVSKNFRARNSILSKLNCTPLQKRNFETRSTNEGQRNLNRVDEETLKSQMSLRLMNENGFLSWCRNAYLSTVVGAAMITEGGTALSLDAGIAALFVGTMNLYWGTACHVTNLVRLRQVMGMSNLILFLNIFGAVLHCLIWSFAIICYLGFLDEASSDAPIVKTLRHKKSNENSEVQ